VAIQQQDGQAPRLPAGVLQSLNPQPRQFDEPLPPTPHFAGDNDTHAGLSLAAFPYKRVENVFYHARRPSW
jgi:hypothetical protein